MTSTTNQEPPKKIAIYYRVSSDEQVDMYWIDVQESKINAWLEYNKDKYQLAELWWKQCIYNESEEKWVSWREEFRNRPVGKDILRDLERYTIINWNPPFEVIVIYKLDRLARKVQVLYDGIKDLEKYWVTVVSATENFDFTTPFGRAMAGILGVFAELERDNFMERSWEGKKQMKMKWWLWTNVYWYDRDSQNKPIIIESEANVINTIFRMYALEWYTIAQICRYLENQKIEVPTLTATRKWENNEESITKKQAKALQKIKWIYARWDQTIRQILRDKKYIWDYYINKTKVNAKTWKSENLPEEERILANEKTPRIVSDELFDKAQQRIWKKANNKIKDNTSYLLSWLLYCDHCKQHRLKYEMCTWQWKPSSGKWEEIYQCYWKRSDRVEKEKKCTCLPLNRIDLDKLVLYHILHLLKNPKALGKIHEEQNILWESRAYIISKLQEKEQYRNKCLLSQKRLKDNYYIHNDWNLTEIDFKEYMKNLNNDIEDAEKEIYEFNKRLSESVDLSSYLDVLSTIHKRLNSEWDISKSLLWVRQLLQYIVKRIVIYSKEVDDKTKLPWRRAEKNPAVPYKISIELKLPQDFIDNFFDFDPTPFNGNPTQSWDDDNLVNKIEKWNTKSESKNPWNNTFNDASGLIHTKHSIAPYWNI